MLWISLFFLFVSAQEVDTNLLQSEITVGKEPKSDKEDKKWNVNTNFSLEHRYDQLREKQNNQTTSLRNLSLALKAHPLDDTEIHLELLGDENRTGDVQVGAGEVYIKHWVKNPFSEDLKIELTAGITKLDYGLLNPIDGQFAVLPSYYKFMYDLPRGLDTGIGTKIQLSAGFFLGANMYAGQNLRAGDDKNREIDVLPHHFQLGWMDNSETFLLSAHYFSRKYRGQPLVSGRGFQMRELKQMRWGWFDVAIEGEVWNLNSSLNGAEMAAMTALIAPKIKWKGLFVQPYMALERWSQPGTPTVGEEYLTAKAGYEWNESFQFIIENTKIRNTQTDLYSEDSFQARIVSNWSY